MNTILALCLTATVCGFATGVRAATPAEAESILFLKQEEKLARDVYTALGAEWGHVTFANIAVSEQRHMDAVDGLIRRFGLVDTTPAAPGAFSIPELQDLYDDLLARGSQSVAEALAVGVLIEETDIADLDAVLKITKDRSIRQVMTNLRQGSYNHLAAFNTALEALAASDQASDPCGASCPADCTCQVSGAPTARKSLVRGRGRR